MIQQILILMIFFIYSIENTCGERGVETRDVSHVSTESSGAAGGAGAMPAIIDGIQSAVTGESISVQEPKVLVSSSDTSSTAESAGVSLSVKTPVEIVTFPMPGSSKALYDRGISFNKIVSDLATTLKGEDGFKKAMELLGINSDYYSSLKRYALLDLLNKQVTPLKSLDSFDQVSKDVNLMQAINNLLHRLGQDALTAENFKTLKPKISSLLRLLENKARDFITASIPVEETVIIHADQPAQFWESSHANKPSVVSDPGFVSDSSSSPSPNSPKYFAQQGKQFIKTLSSLNQDGAYAKVMDILGLDKKSDYTAIEKKVTLINQALKAKTLQELATTNPEAFSTFNEFLNKLGFPTLIFDPKNPSANSSAKIFLGLSRAASPILTKMQSIIKNVPVLELDPFSTKPVFNFGALTMPEDIDQAVITICDSLGSTNPQNSPKAIQLLGYDPVSALQNPEKAWSLLQDKASLLHQATSDPSSPYYMLKNIGTGLSAVNDLLYQAGLPRFIIGKDTNIKEVEVRVREIVMTCLDTAHAYLFPKVETLPTSTSLQSAASGFVSDDTTLNNSPISIAEVHP